MNEMTMLLVEDNADDRFLTQSILKKLPFELQIEISKNGDEALQRLLGKNGAPPAIVLLDLQLPKIGGISLLARVRERYEDLPVIILSSSDNPIDCKLCEELGVSGYLSKPLDRAALQKQLPTIIPP